MSRFLRSRRSSGGYWPRQCGDDRRAAFPANHAVGRVSLGHPWGTLATIRSLRDFPESQNRGFTGFLRVWRLRELCEISRRRTRNAQVNGSNPFAGSRFFRPFRGSALPNCFLLLTPTIPFEPEVVRGHVRWSTEDLAESFIEPGACSAQQGLHANVGGGLVQKIDISVGALVDLIERGELRLPEMQRRYEWRASRVPDLLDSHRSEGAFPSVWDGYPSRSAGMHHSTHQSNAHHGAVSSKTVQVPNRFVTNLWHAISECSELPGSASLQPSFSVIREVEVSSDTLRCTLDSGNRTHPQASKAKKESCYTKCGSRGKPPLRPMPPSGDRT